MFWAVNPAFSAMSMKFAIGAGGDEAVLACCAGSVVTVRSKHPQRRVRTTKSCAVEEIGSSMSPC